MQTSRVSSKSMSSNYTYAKYHTAVWPKNVANFGVASLVALAKVVGKSGINKQVNFCQKHPIQTFHQ